MSICGALLVSAIRPIFDPFLLLDDFRNEIFRRNIWKGFPWHPHPGDRDRYVCGVLAEAMLSMATAWGIRGTIGAGDACSG